jgi:hypothetical protein
VLGIVGAQRACITPRAVKPERIRRQYAAAAPMLVGRGRKRRIEDRYFRLHYLNGDLGAGAAILVKSATVRAASRSAVRAAASIAEYRPA